MKSIWWEPKGGIRNVQFDNLEKLDVLYHTVPANFPINEDIEDMKELMNDGQWNLP